MLATLKKCNYQLTTKQSHYDQLEVDEIWTFVGKKSNKQWLIYAYHRQTGEIVVYVWGKRDLKTVKRLRAELQTLGVTCAVIASDTWDSFVTGFKGFTQKLGKFLLLALKVNKPQLGLRT